MKSYLAKSILLLFSLGGLSVGLLMYNRTFFLLSKIVDIIGYNWVSIILLFLISLVVFSSGSKILNKELASTVILRDISLIKSVKFFIGGFIGCYVGFSLVGTILIIVLEISKYFLL